MFVEAKYSFTLIFKDIIAYTVVLFKCTQQKLGEVTEESEDFKKFKQNYLMHQKQVQSNAVLHEILEDAMNSGQHK